MANDNTLIYRAQTGDEGAFTDLMREYYPLVYTIVIRIVDNSHDVEEVIQDTFLNAYRGLTQLEDTTKFKSWLAEIARNCARQWVRKRRINTIPLDEVGEGVLQIQDSPDERVTRQEQRELIRRTMETLPQKDREIARAFYLEGASYDELTRAHGLSYNAIAFRLSRAKQQLSTRLRYLLAGVFVSPGLTLKKLYMRGLTAMKVGTAPKMTVGVTGLIALIIIGFIVIPQMNAPIVEERVYLSPWEDGTARLRNNPQRFPTDNAQDTASWNNLPQIAVTASTAGTEPVDGFLGESEETDMSRFTTDEGFDIDTVQGFTTGTSASSERTAQSAEDVMYAYMEAFRDSDFEAMESLATEEYMRSNHGDDSSEISVEMSGDTPEDVVETIHQFKPVLVESIRETTSQAEVVSGEYVGDEFHFRLRTPVPEMPDISSDQGTAIFFSPGYQLVKMRKENSAWRVYDKAFDYDSAMSEVPEWPH
jgi:RNA polymerase sigma-70 factor (ECF subfamily)